MNRKWLIVFLVLLLIVGAIGFYFSRKPVREVQEKLPSNGVENSGSINTDNNSNVANQEKLSLPVGFDSVNPSSKISEAARVKFMAQFLASVKDIKETPTSTWAWINLGANKHALGDEKGAEEAWLFATKLSPNHPPAYGNLGQLYWHYLFDYPKSEKMFLTYISIDPSATYIYRDLSDLYRYDYKEKSDQADDILLQGLSANPRDPDLLSALARYYYDMGDRTHAITYYEELVKVAPNNTQAKKDLEDLKAGHPIGSSQ